MKHNNIIRLDEFMNEGSGCMSESAKKMLEKVCEEYLMREAEEYDNDPHESHTYEGYVNESANYLMEIMGNKGYSSTYKHYRR